jgi:hypothetical protein
MANEIKGTNRRDLLAATLGGAAVVAFAATTASAAAKVAQSSVGYQGSPNGDKKCGGCKLFQAPSSCKSVDGSVSASGYCRLYIAA